MQRPLVPAIEVGLADLLLALDTIQRIAAEYRAKLHCRASASMRDPQANTAK